MEVSKTKDPIQSVLIKIQCLENLVKCLLALIVSLQPGKEEFQSVTKVWLVSHFTQWEVKEQIQMLAHNKNMNTEKFQFLKS